MHGSVAVMMPRYRARPDWRGQTVVVLGNGTSLLDVDLSVIAARGARAMVANGGFALYPAADVLMCSDRHWLAEGHDTSGFLGTMIVVTRPEAVKRRDPRMVAMRRQFIGRVTGDPFADPGLLVEGHTSTSTNISLAVLRGAKRIVLAGIDLAPGPGGRRRSTGDETDDPERAAVRYLRQAQHLAMQARWVLRRGIEVVNASPRSVLDCYPHAESLEAAL